MAILLSLIITWRPTMWEPNENIKSRRMLSNFTKLVRDDWKVLLTDCSVTLSDVKSICKQFDYCSTNAGCSLIFFSHASVVLLTDILHGICFNSKTRKPWTHSIHSLLYTASLIYLYLLFFTDVGQEQNALHSYLNHLCTICISGATVRFFHSVMINALTTC